jgi:hypothetical protein
MMIDKEREKEKQYGAGGELPSSVGNKQRPKEERKFEKTPSNLFLGPS